MARFEFMEYFDPMNQCTVTVRTDMTDGDRIAERESLVPDRIVRNGRATIVMWNDGTKTVVKCAEGEDESLYNAVASALAIKVFGSNSAFKSLLKNRTIEQKKKEKKKTE